MNSTNNGANMASKNDLQRAALDLVLQLTPTQNIREVTTARSKALTGRTLLQARKADLVSLVEALRAELATLEATEAQGGPYMVVWLDGVTNSKIASGPYVSMRAALAEARGRRLMVRSAEEISWQGPVRYRIDESVLAVAEVEAAKRNVSALVAALAGATLSEADSDDLSDILWANGYDVVMRNIWSN